MVPYIYSGDLVEIIPYLPDDLRKGDVVAFWDGFYLCIHRLWAKRGEWFITKGDRCYRFDRKVNKDEIIGKVTKVISITPSYGNLWARVRIIRDHIIFKVYSLLAKIRTFFIM